jgi:arylsulfatase A-like enzyme
MGPWMLITKDRNNTQQPELYNLAEDLAETKDLAAEYPEKVKELSGVLKKAQDSGRSRP